MAELPHIGKHCAYTQCNRLDFLSIGCNGCSLSFCKEHYPYEKHSCSKELIPKKDKIESEGPKAYDCQFDGCCNRELTRVICEHCKLNFCLAHRHQPDHKCVKWDIKPTAMVKTKELVDSLVQNKSSTSSKNTGRKSKAMAAKVALMKIKQKAIGNQSIPDSERIFLKIEFLRGNKLEEHAVFVSQIWTIGKCVDEMATKLRIENRNNDAKAKKLKLVDPDQSNHCFSFEQTVQELISSGDLFNGGSLQLKYISSEDEEVTNRV